MKAAGYTVDGLPANSDQLIHDLIARCSYDLTWLDEKQLARAHKLPVDRYADWFHKVPEEIAGDMVRQWGEPPGKAFVHAGGFALAGLEFGNVFVALQPPRGYERAVLDRGEAPAGFVSSVRAVEGERARRADWLAALHADPQRNWLMPSVPRLSPGTTVARRPVLAEGEFVWGMTLSTPSQPEGAPCSPLVAAIARLADGQTSVAAIVDRLSEGLDDTRRSDLRTAVTRTIEILYIDGAVEELSLG